MSSADIPPAFRARFSRHNWHAILVSFLTAVLAGICWLAFYIVVYWGSILMVTLIRGADAEAPRWIMPVFFSMAGALLLIAALDYAFSRYATINDRPIVGWHLLRDFVLFLPRLTFAVFGNLLACRILSKDDLRRAWTLLQRIQLEQRADFFMLSQVEPDARRLNDLLLTLQLTGFVDLHRGEETWFYLICGSQQEFVRGLVERAGEGPLATD